MRQTWFLMLVLLLTSCNPGKFFVPTFTPTSTNTQPRTLTPTLTLTPTSTPTPTPTQTPTNTPTPTPIGGGLIRFNGMVGNDSNCGIMTTDGQIQEKQISGYTSEIPPIDCPERRDFLGPKWSNDNKYYFFWTCCGYIADSILFVGNIYDHNLIQIQTGNYLQSLYPKWLDDQHLLVQFDHSTRDLVVYDTQTGIGKNIGNYPSALPVGLSG